VHHDEAFGSGSNRRGARRWAQAQDKIKLKVIGQPLATRRGGLRDHGAQLGQLRRVARSLDALPADRRADCAQRLRHHYTGWVNACGIPAINLPCAPSRTGLPIGFQLAARFGADELLLDFAQRYEAANPWSERWPAIAYEA